MKRSRASKRRQTLFWLISALVVLSMICSLVLMIRPGQFGPSPTPTRVRPTDTPTTVAHLTATPPPTLTPTEWPTPTPTITSTTTPIASPTSRATLEATPLVVGEEENFVFAICGDNRDGDAIYRKILSMVMADGCAFLINLGDLVRHGYSHEFEHFAELMAGFELPFFPVPGNHDTPDGTLTAYLKYSGAPAAHYSFDYGSVHFSMLNSSLGELSDKELSWLDADLSATKQPVKMVCLHYPPFDPAGTDHILRKGNEEFIDLVTRHRVRYVWAGHIHTYDTTVKNGVTYTITGGAGAPLYPEPNRDAFYHYVRVTVRGEDIATEVVRVEG